MMLNRSVGALRRSTQSLKQVVQATRYFSADPTKEEIATGKVEWGIKYDDECLKFEKEWKVLHDAVVHQQNTFIEAELGDLQQ